LVYFERSRPGCLERAEGKLRAVRKNNNRSWSKALPYILAGLTYSPDRRVILLPDGSRIHQEVIRCISTISVPSIVFRKFIFHLADSC